jgi:anti-anti-sigma factor
MSEFFCDIVRQDDTSILTVSGQLTWEEIEAFNGHCDRVASTRPRCVILELRDLTFISSAGIGALLKLHRRVQEYGGKVCVSDLRPEVRSVFELARLDKIFPVFSSLNDGLAPEQSP